MRTLLVIDNPFILITALVLFILLFFIAWKTDTKWLFGIAGLLWFIPITMIENVFIIVVSSAMLIFCGVLSFTHKEE